MTDSTPSRRGVFERRQSSPDACDERGRPASLAAAAGVGVRKGGRGIRHGLGLIAERIVDSAPRVPVRDLATLRRQFPDLGPEEIADKLVAGATKSSAAVGAGVGAAAMMPVPPALPAELAAEVVGVALVEFKLIAELHEVYGRRAEGGLKERVAAYLGSWSDERGIDVAKPMTVNAALGVQMKRELRQRILKRTFRNLPNLMPFMIGAAVGAVMNRRETQRVADKIRKDLRKHQVPWEALPDLELREEFEEPGSPKALQHQERHSLRKPGAPGPESETPESEA
ncbi:hypothetical protein ACH429_00515 [Streptomyces pathocidini]|uniref:Uncharacterized protein n=1 Tax=Streptomyces pathocidini TaxID=1650571 RepID=A0ABW7UP75_9ACTN|nr:hypothetical protein [Streptomyces pathocidini]